MNPQRLNYAELSDAQLRSTIRFAEERINWIEEDHARLLQSYRDEVTAMRRHLVDRLLSRMAIRRVLLTNEQRRKLEIAFALRALGENDAALLVRSATKGRTDRHDALTEVEAAAVLLQLERRS